jgi:hypothetical protein
MPPEKTETAAAWMLMAAEMVPALLMPPEKVEMASGVPTLLKPTRIPALPALIAPLLRMPPPKVERLPATMPAPIVAAAVIVPALTMPLVNVETFLSRIGAQPLARQTGGSGPQSRGHARPRGAEGRPSWSRCSKATSAPSTTCLPRPLPNWLN